MSGLGPKLDAVDAAAAVMAMSDDSAWRNNSSLRAGDVLLCLRPTDAAAVAAAVADGVHTKPSHSRPRPTSCQCDVPICPEKLKV